MGRAWEGETSFEFVKRGLWKERGNKGVLKKSLGRSQISSLEAGQEERERGEGDGEDRSCLEDAL